MRSRWSRRATTARAGRSTRRRERAVFGSTRRCLAYAYGEPRQAVELSGRVHDDGVVLQVGGGHGVIHSHPSKGEGGFPGSNRAEVLECHRRPSHASGRGSPVGPCLMKARPVLPAALTRALESACGSGMGRPAHTVMALRTACWMLSREAPTTVSPTPTNLTHLGKFSFWLRPRQGLRRPACLASSASPLCAWGCCSLALTRVSRGIHVLTPSFGPHPVQPPITRHETGATFTHFTSSRRGAGNPPNGERSTARAHGIVPLILTSQQGERVPRERQPVEQPIQRHAHV